MRITFFVGTIAELIKLAPVMLELERRGAEFSVIASGQNDLRASDWGPLLDRHQTIRLSKGPNRPSTLGLLGWFFRVFFSSLPRLYKQGVKVDGHCPGWLLVHGDTVSTLMGALLGRLCGFRVGHVEAGLRSFRLFRPFPEEICRRLVSRLAQTAFCPNDWAVSNLLAHRRIERINTQCNTLYDAMRAAMESGAAAELPKVIPDRFFILVLHRQENLMDRQFVERMLDLVIEQAAQIPCVVIMHRPMERMLERCGLRERLNATSVVYPLPRLPYGVFTRLLQKAEFILTDGGSNQEEAFFLGKPCLILRRETERIEGVGANALLSGKDFDAIRGFLRAPERYRRDPVRLAGSPSGVIADYLLSGNSCSSRP